MPRSRTVSSIRSTNVPKLAKACRDVVAQFEALEPRQLMTAGLLGTYYKGANLAGTPTARVDANVNFNWGTSEPVSGLSNNNYSVRWSGFIKPDLTGSYTFSTTSDDGVRLWVNGKQLVNNWTDHAAATDSGSISLEAGQSYTLAMDYYQRGGLATAVLLWSLAGASAQTVPTTNLTAAPSTLPVVPASLQATSPSATEIDITWSDSSNGQNSFVVQRSSDGNEYTAIGSVGAGTTKYADKSVSFGPLYYYRVVATGGADQSAPSASTGPIVSLAPASIAGNGHGLVGIYYNGRKFSDPVLTRVDPSIDFDWGANAPADKIDGAHFTTQWTGQIFASETGKYTIYTNSDDGVRLWVDGKQLVNNFTNHAATVDSGEISLVAGQRYDVVLQYFNDSGLATMQLAWATPSKAKAIIPTTALYPTDNATGDGVSSPPVAPTGVSATDATTGNKASVTVTWKDVPAETGFIIYRSTDAMTFTKVAKVEAAVLSYTDADVKGNTTYTYRVAATNSMGDSPFSTTCSVTTKSTGPAPTAHLALKKPAFASSFEKAELLATNATDGDPTTRWASTFNDPQWIYVDLGAPYNVTQVDIQWENASAKAFQIQVSNDAKTWTDIYSTTTSTGGHQTISGLSGDGQFVRIYGTKRNTEWGYSLVDFDVSGVLIPPPLPTAPTSLGATASPGQVSLSWTASTGAKSYNLYRGDAAGAESTTPIATAVTGTSYVDTTIKPDSTYYYIVRGVNESGPGEAAKEISVKTLPPPPAGPTRVSAMASEATRVVVAWKEVKSATGYTILRSADGATYAPVGTADGLDTSYIDSTAKGSTKYWYEVVAKGAWGSTAASSPATVTTPAAPTDPVNKDKLDAPQTIRATPTSWENITISWADVKGESGYDLLRSTDGVNFSKVTSLLADVNNFADTSLSAGTTYYYSVIATGAPGNSNPTALATATTEAKWIEPGQPAPTPSGGWTTSGPIGIVTPTTSHPNNIFYVGENVSYQVGGNAVTYQVRDYHGNLVDTGKTQPTTTLNVNQPGWYKLYVYGSSSTAQFGNIVGTSTFVIFRKDSNFVQLSDFYYGGYYFIDSQFKRVDPAVNFNWGYSSPGGSIPNTNYGVEWTGQLKSAYSETYTLSTKSDDGVRVWIDDKLVIDNWSPHGAATDFATLNLDAGRRYNIKVRYFQLGWDSTMSMSWSSAHTPTQIIPASALYASASATTPSGLTGEYFVGLNSSDTSENQIVHGITAMGPERYNVSDLSDPAATIEYLKTSIIAAKATYLNRDPARPSGLLVAFTNGTANLAAVKQIVTALQNDVTHWEGQNEPNYSYSGSDYVKIEKAFYETVKSVNPKLKVIGPATVSIMPDGNGLHWINDFLANGGGKYIDALSFHAYNTNQGSLTQLRRSMQGLKDLLTAYGLNDLPLWQTEQGYFAATYGVYTPQIEGQWQMLQMMAYEQFGIPKEQNVLWYDASHGFWDFPAWWQNDDGTLNPVADLMRVWSEELYGTQFHTAFDFGSANDLYIGTYFSGSDRSVAAFMAAGQKDGQILLNVTGTDKLKTVSATGVESYLPVINGQVKLNVAEEPTYVEVPAGQSIDVVPEAWGANLARQPGVQASSSRNSSGIEKIINGVEENWYWNGVGPWGDSNYNDPNGWVQLAFPKSQSISRVVIKATSPWQLTGTLLDFELQYMNPTGEWTTLSRTKQQPKTFGVYSPVTRTTADTYFDNQFIFNQSFSPVNTDKIRLLIHSVTYGGGATAIVPQSGGQASSTPTLSLAEIEVYGQ